MVRIGVVSREKGIEKTESPGHIEIIAYSQKELGTN